MIAQFYHVDLMKLPINH